MLAFTYKTKKELKAAVGEPLRYVETSMFDNEYHGDGTYTGVGPAPHIRKWYANVTVEHDVIKTVK